MPAHGIASGVNDRFAFAAPGTAAVYATRLYDTFSRCLHIQGQPVHAEHFLSLFIMDHKMEIEFVKSFDFFRARVGGHLVKPELRRLKGCNRTALDMYLLKLDRGTNL